MTGQEEKVGSPEKPLSDLGAAAYRSYWASVIIQAVQSFVVSKHDGCIRPGMIGDLTVSDSFTERIHTKTSTIRKHARKPRFDPLTDAPYTKTSILRKYARRARFDTLTDRPLH